MVISEEVDDFSKLLAACVRNRKIVDRDLRNLRHAFYRHVPVERRLAAEIFQANRLMPEAGDGWIEFYLEALVDFFLEKHGDSASLSSEAEAALLAWLGEGQPIANRGECRLVQRLLLTSDVVSERFERRVLDAMAAALLLSERRWPDGGPRKAGVIDAVDMQMIRHSVDRVRRQQASRVSRASVDFLLHLHHQAAGFSDPDGWRVFLAGAIARHIGGTAGSITEAAFDAGDPADREGKLDSLLYMAGSPCERRHLRHDVLEALKQLPMASPIEHPTW